MRRPRPATNSMYYLVQFRIAISGFVLQFLPRAFQTTLRLFPKSNSYVIVEYIFHRKRSNDEQKIVLFAMLALFFLESGHKQGLQLVTFVLSDAKDLLWEKQPFQLFSTVISGEDNL